MLGGPGMMPFLRAPDRSLETLPMTIENEAERGSKLAADAADLDRQVRERAHRLWEAEGKQDGKADDYIAGPAN